MTLARELIDLVTAQPGMNTTAIKKAIGGNAYRIGDELARLEVDGKVRHTIGSRNAKLWHLA